MKFLITEIALYLAAAGVLGLIIGWLMKASGAKRRINAIKAEAESKLKAVETEKNAAITALTEDRTSLETRNTQLAADAKQAATALAQVEQKRVLATTELEKSRELLASSQAEAKSHQDSIHKAKLEIEQLATQQDELQVKLTSIRESKDLEIAALEKQISAFAGHSTTHSNAHGTATPDSTGANNNTEIEAARRAQLEQEARAQKEAADKLNAKLDSVAQEREQLMREREEVISRTRQLESELKATATNATVGIKASSAPAYEAPSNPTVDASRNSTARTDNNAHRVEADSDLDQSMEIDEPDDIFDDAGLQSVIEESTGPTTDFDHGLSSYDRFDESFDNLQPQDNTIDTTGAKPGYSDPLRDRLHNNSDSNSRPTLWDRVRSSVVKSDTKN